MNFIPPDFRKRTPGNIKVVWIILLALVILFGAFKVLPSFMEWQTTREKVVSLTAETDAMTETLATEKTRREEVEKKFKETAEGFVQEERQLYPDKIDTNKIAKILELFSLNETIVNGRNALTISNLSFGIGNNTKSQTQATRVSITLESDQDSLRSFIQFLQSGKIPESFERAKAQKPISPINASEYQFLKNNLLPMCLIDSIKASPTEEGSKILKTTIQLRFFSQG